MIYHTSNIRLVQPFLIRDNEFLVHTNLLENVKLYRNRAKDILYASLKELRRLLTLHETHLGWEKAIPYVLHPIMVTSLGSLEKISGENGTPSDEAYLGLLTCLRALNCMSNFIYYAQPLSRLVIQACEALAIRVPIDILNTAIQYKSAEWTKSARIWVKSQYVADLTNAVTGIGDRRMDTVIEQWDRAMIIGAHHEENKPYI